MSYTLSPREENKMLLTFALEELVKGLPPFQHLSGGVSGKDKKDVRLVCPAVRAGSTSAVQLHHRETAAFSRRPKPGADIHYLWALFPLSSLSFTFPDGSPDLISMLL